MNAMPTPPQYLVEAGDPARDRETVLSLWRGNLGQDARMTAKYEWFYLRCPHGEPLLQLLHAATVRSPCRDTTDRRCPAAG